MLFLHSYVLPSLALNVHHLLCSSTHFTNPSPFTSLHFTLPSPLTSPLPLHLLLPPSPKLPPSLHLSLSFSPQVSDTKAFTSTPKTQEASLEPEGTTPLSPATKELKE